MYIFINKIQLIKGGGKRESDREKERVGGRERE